MSTGSFALVQLRDALNAKSTPDRYRYSREWQIHPALGPLGIGRLVTVNTEGSVKLADVLSKIDFQG